jgi:hypothetical protein
VPSKLLQRGFGNHPFLGVVLTLLNVFGWGFVGTLVWQQQNFGPGGNSNTNPTLGVNVKLAPYNAIGNGKFFVDGVTNAGNNQLTSATATFSATDINQVVTCYNAPQNPSVAAWPPGQTTINGFVNASTVTYAGTNAGVKTGMYCTLTNPADPAAIMAAFNFCKSTFNAPSAQTSTQGPACNIYLPTGIYGTNATLNNLISTGNEGCVGIVGDGMTKTGLIPTFTFTNANRGGGGWLIDDRCLGAYLKDFYVEVASNPVVFGVTNAAINITGGRAFLQNVAVYDGCSTGGTWYGITVGGGSNIVLDRPTVIAGSTCGGTVGGLQWSGSEGDVYSLFLSNTQQNLLVFNELSGSTGSGVRFFGGVIDEGSITSIQSSIDVWFMGTSLIGGANCISVDATSYAYMIGGYCGTFGGGTGGGPTVASGGVLEMSSVRVRGVNAGSYCYNAAALGGILDLGGNKCDVSGGATVYNAGSAAVQFPLTTRAQTQLGGQQVVSGLVPTSCTITGNGTSTCAFDTGSTDAAGRITITAAGATTAVGLVSFNFSATYGTNSTTCSANYLSGTGAWAIGAIAPIFITSSTSAASFNINNNAVNLTATSTYKVSYTCYGQ